MLGWILDRLVERAVPPDVENPEQERIAEEAAENGIRQAAAVAGIAGVIVFAALATIVYAFLPSQQVVQVPAKPSEVVSHVEADNEEVRQAKEELERKLEQVTIERDKLQGKVADLEWRVADLAKQQPSASRTAVLPKDGEERERLQGKVSDLERQVADLTRKLETTKVASVPDTSPPISRPATGSANTRVAAEPRAAYRCGDGRTVRNPSACRAATAPTPPASLAEESAPTIYYCGDGRTVPNPTECRAASVSPRG